MKKVLFNFKKVALTLTMGAALTGCYTDKTVSVLVQTPTGATIPNADIIVDNKTYKTDANGVASFNVQVPKSTKQVVINYKKEGFVNQSVLYDIPTAKNINVSASLLPIKQTITVDQIELAQTIESKELHAKIDIPASAFVLPNGKVATGKISVDFTPWDITSNDLNAMPANGVAKDKSGKIVNLISAGMISATFKNAAGQELQLARNKTADIQMDLPLKSINNQEMKAGVSIPMWHFDEKAGLWSEEGTGYVIESEKSSTGLAVQAKVNHFSTWNWDFKYENAGSVFVQCQSKGVGVPCNVIAKVSLNDGSGLTHANSLPAEGYTVVNMPSSGSIQWTAKDVTGILIGEKTSGTTGNVIIDLGTPTTDNTVKCTLADGTAVACSGKLNNEFDFSISKDGGKIISTLKDDDGQLEWTAQSSLIFDNNEWVRFKGAETSSVNGNVTIKLANREVVYTAEKTIHLVCMLEGTCSGSISITKNGQWDQEIFSKEISIETGKTISISLPIVDDNDQVSLNFGGWVDDQVTECSNNYFKYGELSDKQIINIAHNGC
nr:astroprincin family protein [Acinetobacter sp. Marseille-Q1620]